MLREGPEENYGHCLSWDIPMAAGVELDTYKKAPYFDKEEDTIIL